jgi:hypothetical protein
LENKIVCWGESIIAGVEKKSFLLYFYMGWTNPVDPIRPTQSNLKNLGGSSH